MAAKFEEIKSNIDSALKDETKPWNKAFALAEEKTGISRLYLFAGGAAIVVLYLAFGYAAQLLCNVIGVAYPAYVSMKALETRSKEDDTRWLTYWVIYGVLSVVEHFSVFLTRFIPFYWLLKCIFFIWCMIPIQSNGSVIVYSKIIRPFFLKHEAAADELVDKLMGKAKQVAGDVISKKIT